MKLEMICTGEEVLSGQIVDTNAAWFANTMMDHGIELQRRITVGDRIDDLASVFTERSHHADIILVNGGLGPTSDDLSAEAMAKALGKKLVEHTPWREHLEEWFTKRDRKMPASNLKQCYLPETAILVDNPPGSAPGFRVKFNNAWLFFTPGVPFEFKQMVEEQFLPFIKAHSEIKEPTKLLKLLTLGHGESSMADRLDKITVPPGITVGYRPSIPHVEVKLFARGNSAISALPDFHAQIKQSLGTGVVSERFPSIAEELHHLLCDSGKTLSIAESCTGGMLCNQLVQFSGSSAYLQQGLVTYSNSAKIKVLKVSQQTLTEYGAVSWQIAHEMAQAVRKILDSDFALSTTGVAGPEGGSEDKPVGMVAIALAIKNKTWVQTLQLSHRSRNLMRSMSTAIAFDMLRRQLLNEAPVVDYPFISRSDLQIIDE